jgi:hypothetical protein
VPLYIALSLESPLYFFPFSVFLKVKWLKKKQKIHVPAAPRTQVGFGFWILDFISIFTLHQASPQHPHATRNDNEAERAVEPL